MEEFESTISEDSNDSFLEDYDYYDYEKLFPCKDTEKEVSIIDTLKKGLRFIFAEDLVSFIALEFHGLVYTTKIKKCLKSNLLNETFRHAVHSLRWQINNINCKSFAIIEKLSKSSKYYYQCFVDSVISQFTDKGLKAGTFLCLCVYFVEVALNCRNSELEKILDFAVYAILDAFCIYDGGMYDLNNFAEAVVSKVKDLNCYPEYNPSWLTEAEVLAGKDQTYQEKCIKKYISGLKSGKVDTQSVSDLKLFGELNKYDLASIFQFVVNNIEPIKSQSSDGSEIDPKNKVMDVQTDLELKLNEEYKCDLRRTLQFLENNIESFKFNEYEKSDNGSFVISKEYIIVLIEEFFCTLCKKLPSLSKTQLLEDYVQEVMSVVSSQAELFLEIYYMSESPKKSVSLKEGEFEDNSMELCKCSNALLQDLDLLPETLSNNFCRSESKTVVFKAPFLEQKEENPEPTVFYTDEKILNSEHDFEQNKSVSEKSSDDCKNSTVLQVEKITQTDCDNSSEESGFVSDNNTATPDDCKDQEEIVEILAVYKREGELNEENLKILKGESLLFAEDIVSYISKKAYGVSYSESKFEDIRDRWWNPFNEDVKEVTLIFHNESGAVNEVVSDLIERVKDHQTDCFRRYVAAVLSHYVEDGLKSDAFLYYCWHFSEIAAKLYRDNLPEILDFAVYSILDAFCLLKDDWKEFNVAVEKLLKNFKGRTYEHDSNPKVKRCRFTDDFERECVINIFDSLKEITRFRS